MNDYAQPEPVRTIVSPGGRSPSNHKNALHVQNDVHNQSVCINGLVDMAAPILQLISYIQQQGRQPDLRLLKEQATAGIRAFYQKTMQHYPEKVARVARYILAATLDDIVMNAPWGDQLEWSERNLVSEIEGHVIGGEHFFAILEQACNNPSQHKDVIELIYICLSLGFKGEARSHPDPHHIDNIRQNIFETIARQRQGIENKLSINWLGAKILRKKLFDFIPLWAAVLGVIALISLFFGVSLQGIGIKTHRVEQAVAQMGVASTVMVSSVAPAADPIAPEYVPPPQPPSVPEVEMRRFLEAEIDEGLISTPEPRANYLMINLIGDGMFAPGSEVLESKYHTALERVAFALKQRGGAIEIVGHTDSVQPRSTARFPTNQKLSEARAHYVLQMVNSVIQNPQRLYFKGVGATEPVADNRTTAGRARNRRIELRLYDQP